MLTHLALHDFKSFTDTELPLAPLTLLVGANASGKSNVLDALRLLKGLSLPLGVNEALNGKPGIWTGVRGGSQETARSGASGFRIESRWTRRSKATDEPPFPDGPPPLNVCHDLSVRCLPTVGIDREEFGGEGLDAQVGGEDMLVNGLSVVGPAMQVRLDDGAEYAWTLRQAVAGLRPLDLRPDALRGYFSTATSTMGEHGEGLISALYRRLQREPGLRADLVDWIAELCAPKVIDIDFVEVTETGDVLLVLVEEGPRRITSRCVSDGTLRFLGLLAALWLDTDDAVFFMEEPDLGLHPARLGLLAELLETRSSRTQVIATTHSPALLGHLSEGVLGDAITFGRNAETGASQASRLRDLAHFDVLQKSRDVAHLFSTGWMERAL